MLNRVLGDLSYNEYKYVFGGFAATDAGVIIAAFDADSNGILEGAELTNWKSTVQQMIAQWGWNPSQETTNCLVNAWSSADRELFIFKTKIVKISESDTLLFRGR